MSATPRTDAQVQSTNRQIDLIGCAPDGGLGPVDAVTAEFARQLERELDKCITAGLLMSAELKRRDGPKTPVAWIASHENGRVRHFAKADGWQVEPVLFAEPVFPPNQGRNDFDK